MSLACCEIFHTVLVFLLSALCKGLRDSGDRFVLKAKWFSHLACKYQRLSSLRPPLWYFSLPLLVKGFSSGQVWIPAGKFWVSTECAVVIRSNSGTNPESQWSCAVRTKWLAFQKPKWFLFRAPLNLFSSWAIFSVGPQRGLQFTALCICRCFTTVTLSAPCLSIKTRIDNLQ